MFGRSEGERDRERELGDRKKVIRRDRCLRKRASERQDRERKL